MEITQQLRDFAKAQGLETEEAIAVGLLEKSAEFTEGGAEIYA